MGDFVEYSQSIIVSGKMLESADIKAKVRIYQEEKKVLQGFVHNKAEQKAEYYSKKISEMKQKYDMDFSAFQTKLYLRAGEIELEEWNDFVLWRSYLKAYRYWSQFC